MLSVIIPTLNAAKTLPATFGALMDALVDGMISEVIITDGGSSDATSDLAETTGAIFISQETASRGGQQKAGASAAKANWLLFLHADTELETGWHEEVRGFISQHQAAPENAPAAAFRFALKDTGLKPALLTGLVRARCRCLHLPYGDQGLLISKALYEKLGGHAAIPLMEDVELIRRLPQPPHYFSARAFTSAERYKSEGYLRRGFSNLYCLTAYLRGKDPAIIRTWYDNTPA